MGITNPNLAYMFDDAVLTFGLHIDGKLGEKDKGGRYVHSVDTLLKDEDAPVKKVDNTAAFAKLAQMSGVKVL